MTTPERIKRIFELENRETAYSAQFVVTQAVSVIRELIGVIEKQRSALEFAKPCVKPMRITSVDFIIDEALQLSAPYVNLLKE